MTELGQKSRNMAVQWIYQHDLHETRASCKEELHYMINIDMGVLLRPSVSCLVRHGEAAVLRFELSRRLTWRELSGKEASKRQCSIRLQLDWIEQY